MWFDLFEQIKPLPFILESFRIFPYFRARFTAFQTYILRFLRHYFSSDKTKRGQIVITGNKMLEIKLKEYE